MLPRYCQLGVEIQLPHLASVDIWEGVFLITVGWGWLFQLPTRPPMVFPCTGWVGVPCYSSAYDPTHITGVGLFTVAGMKVLAPYLALSDITQLFFVVFARAEWLLSKCFMSC